ncbi:MAG: class I SAM-dependent methyltransferase [Chloroflexota bacterium]|nr:class I SAM-dependent methyltransferase [Chloroflexota bacterium]
MRDESSRGQRALHTDAERGDQPARDPSSLPRPNSRRPLPEAADGLPQPPPAFWRTIDDGLRALSLELTAGQRSAIDAHARLLIAWSSAINLTALRTPEQIARTHVLDSLSALPLLRRLGSRRLLDLGSGAGYPGLPLAVALPAGDCGLVDSVRKKASFLEVASRAAAGAMDRAAERPPRFMTLAERAEDLADEVEHRERWDAVLARAVGSLAEVVELGLPLVRLDGHVVAWKSDLGDGALAAEIGAAGRMLQATGGSRPRVERPAGLSTIGLTGHVLVVVRKRRPTPDRYPRPPGERRRAQRA